MDMPREIVINIYKTALKVLAFTLISVESVKYTVHDSFVEEEKYIYLRLRIVNILLKNNISYIDDLIIKIEEVKKLPGMGAASMYEIDNFIKAYSKHCSTWNIVERLMNIRYALIGLTFFKFIT